MAEPKAASQRRYPAELRDRAVRLVLEEYERSQERPGVLTRIAAQLGIGTESLRAWVKQGKSGRFIALA